MSSDPVEDPRASRLPQHVQNNNPWFGMGTNKLSTVESSYATEINEEKY